MNHEKRFGRFTSSQIYKLLSQPTAAAKKEGEVFGKPALTYIGEKNMEIRLGRSLTTEQGSRETTWGTLVEARVFELLGTEYSYSSTHTDIHPTIPTWSGSKDGMKHDDDLTVFDIKCPFTLKSFCNFADCKTIEEVVEKHDSGEAYKWQLVSNAILTGAKFAELIFYVPYREELSEIRDMASNFQGDQNKVAWVQWATDEDLPYLIKDGYYKNLNIIRFEVSEADKALLTEKVLAASKLLIEIKTEATA